MVAISFSSRLCARTSSTALLHVLVQGHNTGGADNPSTPPAPVCGAGGAVHPLLVHLALCVDVHLLRVGVASTTPLCAWGPRARMGGGGGRQGLLRCRGS
jgi:hypothetical protein